MGKRPPLLAGQGFRIGALGVGLTLGLGILHAAPGRLSFRCYTWQMRFASGAFTTAVEES